jgi:HEAT repeat protein
VFAVARLLRDGDERERTKACRALGRIGRTEVVPFLIEALDDASSTVRAIAARALGDIGDDRCVPALGIHLTDRNWWVRANAAESLRRCGPRGILALQRALESDDPFARDRAAEVLALHAAAQGARAA